MQGIDMEKIFCYKSIFEPHEEGNYIVIVPALTICISEGDT